MNCKCATLKIDDADVYESSKENRIPNRDAERPIKKTTKLLINIHEALASISIPRRVIHNGTNIFSNKIDRGF